MRRSFTRLVHEALVDPDTCALQQVLRHCGFEDGLNSGAVHLEGIVGGDALVLNVACSAVPVTNPWL